MEIRWSYIITAFIYFATLNTAGAAVDYINGNYDNLSIFNNTVISDSAIINGMYIENSAVINNAGTINGEVAVCYGCDVYIKNSGNINAAFDIPDSSRVIQVINDEADVNFIGVTKNFQINVEDADRLSWDKLYCIAKYADRLIVNNSGINLNTAFSNINDGMGLPVLEMHGNIIVYINDILSFGDSPVLSNINGDATITIKSEYVNPLYRFYSYMSGNDLYVDVVRDTDYFKIMKNDLGVFLNNLRVLNPDDILLSKLDNAETMEEINNIIFSSVRLTPLSLMDTVNAFNMFTINNMANISNGIVASPMFIYSDKFSISGINLDVNYEFMDGLILGISVYAGNTDFSNDIEIYESELYGGNLHVSYIGDLLLARMMTGMTFSKFDIGPVFNGKDTIVNPTGNSLYSIADIGVVFDAFDKFSFAPFIRGGLSSVEVAGLSDRKFISGVGTDVWFNVKSYDIKYKYGITFGAFTSGQISTDIYIDIISAADRAGGVIELGFIRDEFDNISYRIKTGVKITF